MYADVQGVQTDGIEVDTQFCPGNLCDEDLQMRIRSTLSSALLMVLALGFGITILMFL